MKIVIRILAIILVILLAFTAVFLVLGLMSPKEYKGSLGKEINVSQDKLWDILTDIENVPNVREEIHSVEVLSSSNGKVDMWNEYIAGGSKFFKFKITERVPKTKLSNKILESNVGIEGGWTYELENRGPNKTFVRMTEDSKATDLFMRGYMKIFGRDMVLKNEFEFLESLDK